MILWIYEDDSRLHVTEQAICCIKLLSTSLVKASGLLCREVLFPVILIFKSCLCILNLPTAIINKFFTLIPQIDRLSVVLPQCSEVSLITNNLYCVFCGLSFVVLLVCLSLWGLNTRITSFIEINRKRTENLSCYQKVFLALSKILYQMPFTKEPMQLLCPFSYIYIYLYRYFCRWIHFL